MDNLHYLPGYYFPRVNTQAHKALRLLADGRLHSKQEFLQLLSDDPRSALQSLRGETHNYWLIHNSGDTKGIYQLDDRHLSGNRNLDQLARNQAAMMYWERSKTQSEKAIGNLPIANQKLSESRFKAEAQPSFDFTEKEKPAEV